ncbi:cytochrome c [Inquilinus sp. CAU 1745]|uniref:c-type cytochrome n=1 Tax=Inquilinus sp. CAU 1745 TaxID=3140369 RepID=UPI00325B4E6D
MLKPLAISALAAAAIVGSGAFFPGVAQTPEEMVETRQDAMETLGDSAKTTAKFIQGEAGTVEDVQAAAADMAEVAPRLPDLFPEGTGQGVDDSDALPAIWENPDDFAERVEAAQAAIADFQPAAESGDPQAIRAAFAVVGQACSGCHDNFRAEDD